MYWKIKLEEIIDLRERLRARLADCVGEVIPVSEEARYAFSQRFVEVARGGPHFNIFGPMIRVSMPRDDMEIMKNRLVLRIWLEVPDGNCIDLLEN